MEIKKEQNNKLGKMPEIINKKGNTSIKIGQSK
jgi:hypothetical protein